MSDLISLVLIFASSALITTILYKLRILMFSLKHKRESKLTSYTAAAAAAVVESFLSI
jgi:hypothetical protein